VCAIDKINQAAATTCFAMPLLQTRDTFYLLATPDTTLSHFIFGAEATRLLLQTICCYNFFSAQFLIFALARRA
jgi:hypothetical protein